MHMETVNITLIVKYEIRSLIIKYDDKILF